MKTILGKSVLKFQFYKMNVGTSREKLSTRGFIWFEDGTSIRVEGSKFFIYLKDRKKLGFISNKMKSYKKIKRMIARWFQLYRKHGTFNNGTSYFKSRCTDGMHNANIFKAMKLPFAENKSKFLKLAI